MTILFTEPSFVPVSGNSVVYPGAKLYFYETGTSNLQNTYSEYTLTTAHANPVVADADGRFAPIYLDPNLEDYKVVLKDSSDVTIWTVDPYSAVNNTKNLGTMPDLLVANTALGNVSTNGYHTAGDGGGGEFYWDASQDKANHNGGTIIDPDITFPSDWTNAAQVAAWFTAGIGTGCWVRIYSSDVNVKWFGAFGDGATDDTSAIQEAIDAADGRKILIPEGVYKITSTLFYNPSSMTNSNEAAFMRGLQLYGEGSGVTVFDNQVANGPMLQVSGEETPTKTQWSMFAELKDFAITAISGSPVNSDGIRLNAIRFSNFEGLFIHDITGKGLDLIQNLSIETDQPAYLKFTRVFIRDVGGLGVNIERLLAGAGVSVAYIDFDTCSMEYCATGGIYAENFSVLRYINGNLIGNGATGSLGGLTVRSSSRNSDTLILENNEIANGNYPYEVRASGINSFISGRNRYGGITADPQNPTNGIILGFAGETTVNFTSDSDRIAYQPGVTPFTFFKCEGTVQNVNIINPYYFEWDAGKIKYDWAETTPVGTVPTNLVLLEDNQYKTAPTIDVDYANVDSDNYTPNIAKAAFFRVSVVAPGTALAFQDPTPSNLNREGRIIVFKIGNGLGVGLTPTFSSKYQMLETVPTIPSSGGTATVQFIYDGLSAKYVQIGAWAVTP